MSTFEKIRKAALARLDAGEPVHIILQDYADFEDELRPILEQASGKPITSYSISKPKVKAKNTSSRSLIWVLAGVAAAIVLLVALGAAYTLPAEQVTTASIQSETSCVGIPQAQITSLYAQQNQNQNSVSSDGSGTTGSTVGGRTESTGAVYHIEDDEVAAVPPAMPESGGGSSSTGDAYGFADTATGSEPGSPLPTMAPLSTSTTTLLSEDDKADMDMEEPMEAVEEEASEIVLRETSADGADFAAGSPSSDLVYGGESEDYRATVSTDPLRAGEIDDNAEWDDYQDYRNDFLDTWGSFAVRNVDTTGRQVIRVIDNNGNPVLNACVEIYNGDSHITSSLTYATGMTMFFPNLDKNTRYVDSYRVVVSKGDVATEATLDREVVGGVTTIELPINQQYDRVQLDVMFLLDATGSMGEEIAQLQGNILAISDQIDALPDNVDVRYGLVSYRDRGDAYVTRVHDFTKSVAEFQDQLLSVQALGGGDYPESMNEGLDMALNAVQWRSGDTVRLMFLVADAPPHVDYQNDADYSLLMQDALSRGIKIHQIASGGLEPEGEFVMRQIAQFTMGRFLFLTYEEGVVGTVGDDRPDLNVGVAEDEQGVGDYSVSQLDELVLRLITDEIEALRGA